MCLAFQVQTYLSLITTNSVAALGALVGSELEIERFRPNLLVQAASAERFPEDGWVGTVLRIGALRMRVDRRDERCAVVSVDPATDERDPLILKTIARERQALVGVYGTIVRPGGVAIGDAVVAEA